MTNLTVLTALENFSARDVPPAVNPSQVLAAPDSSHSRDVTGTMTVSSVAAARVAWWARVSSQTEKISSVQSAQRKNLWQTLWNNRIWKIACLLLHFN